MYTQANIHLAVSVITLLLLILWIYKSRASRSENLGGVDEDQVFTSGADMRILGQQFSGTNQGSPSFVHNMQLPIE